MKFTGERMIEHEGSRAEWISHQCRYRFAGAFVEGKHVIDIACGSGYGSRILAASNAKEVTGVDISEEAVEFARKHYQHPALRFFHGDSERKLFDDGSFDIITSFETIEHLNSPEAFLENAIQLLRADGTLIISTPNLDALFGERTSFSPYHIHEFHFAEFDTLLHQYFTEIEYYWQHWPIEMPRLRRAAFGALEEGRLGWAKRLFPKWLKQILSTLVSLAMRMTLNENRLKPYPWSTLVMAEDACIIIALARSPRHSLSASEAHCTSNAEITIGDT